MLERRTNPVGRAATATIPRISLGGLRIAVLDLEQTADFMINLVFPRRMVGRPLVTASRLRPSLPLPERVATTDLFHIVARKAEAANLSFYMFGAEESENAAAVANIRKMYPRLRI